jgi:hypothetical protein
MTSPQDQFFYYLKPLLQQLHEIFPECVMTATLCSLKDHLRHDVDRVAQAWYKVMSVDNVADAVLRRDATPLGLIDNEWIRKLDLATKITSDRLTEESRATLWQYVDILTEHSRNCYNLNQSIVSSGTLSSSSSTPTTDAPPLNTTENIAIPDEFRPIAGAMAAFLETLVSKVPLPPAALTGMKSITESIAADIQDGRLDLQGWLQKAQQMANRVPEDELASMALQGAALQNTVLQGLSGLGGQTPSTVGGATFETMLASLLNANNASSQ